MVRFTLVHDIGILEKSIIANKYKINKFKRKLFSLRYSSPNRAASSTGGVTTNPTFIYSPQPIVTPFFCST